MARQREQLALAEHLFDLGQTFYPELSKARLPQGPSVLHCKTIFARLFGGQACTQERIFLAGRDRAEAPGERVRRVRLPYGLAAHVLGLPVE